MKTFLYTVFGISTVCILGICVIGIIAINAYNTEKGLRNAFKAQEKSNQSSFDKLWKTIKQSANIAEVERESFKEAYAEIMQSTKGVSGEGKLASFFTQAKVDISSDLFKKLMTIVESQRESFHRDQQTLIKIKQEHDNIRTKLPSSLFVGGSPELQLTIITSTHTEGVFESGKDDNIEL